MFCNSLAAAESVAATAICIFGNWQALRSVPQAILGTRRLVLLDVVLSCMDAFLVMPNDKGNVAAAKTATTSIDVIGGSR